MAITFTSPAGIFVMFASAYITLALDNCPVKLPCYCNEKTVENSKAITIVDVMCSQRGLNSIPKTEWNSLPETVQVDEVIFSTNFIQNFSKHLFDVLQPRVIDLSENNLNTLKVDFTNFQSRLEELYLSHNHNMRFPIAAIADMKALKVLDISDTLTTNLDFDEFARSTSLEILILKSNTLDRLDEMLFSKLKNLKELDLSDNQFDEIPSAIKKCITLEKCNLKDNYIENIQDDTFLTTPKLTWLSLTNNELHFDMFTAKTFRGLENSLEKLYMSDIYIDKIPKISFTILKKLRFLEICNSYIKVVTGGVFIGLESLEELVLCEHDSGIQFKERAFEGVETSLKKLSLVSNRLDSVPHESLSILSKLEELDLAGNILSKISSRDFKGLSSLRVLRLDYNEQLTIDDDAFKYVSTTLKELYLRNVKKASPPAALSMLNVLHKLDISNNNIRNVPENFFGNVSARNVVISGCKITNITSRAFVRLYERANQTLTIDASRNELTDLTFMTDAAIFAKVNLRSNPIHCGCHELAVSMCSAVEIVGHCSLPESVAGENLRSDRFIKTMTKLCNSNVSSLINCPETSATTEGRLVVCDLQKGGGGCVDSGYRINNTGSVYRPGVVVVVATILLNIT